MNASPTPHYAAEISVRPLSPALGAEIVGADLSGPLSDAAFEEIFKAWCDNLILLFRNQNLTAEAEVAFAERFGPLATIHTPQFATLHPAVMLISNIREDGKAIGALPDGEMQFHSDQCYKEKPAAASMLYAIEIPREGGDTLFANAYKAYETLPRSIKDKIDCRRALNAYDYDSASTRRGQAAPDAPSCLHPVVRTHPVTGRKSLYVNRLMTVSIEGLPEDESAEILEFLFAHQERPEFIYQHVWRPGDLVMWDNRCTLHARTDFSEGERRLLRRVTILGETPI